MIVPENGYTWFRDRIDMDLVWDEHDPDPQGSLLILWPIALRADRRTSQTVNDRRPFQDRPHHRDRRTPRCHPQPASKIADAPGFPTPVGREGQSRLWDRREVTAWAKVWWREKPWR